MTVLPYTVLHAFSTSSTGGNEAAVITLPPPSTTATGGDEPFAGFPSTESLQAIATQLGYPATCFLQALSAADAVDGNYSIRCFDTTHELELCGHGNIALSHYLFSLPGAPTQLELNTVKHGLVTAEHSFNPFDKTDKRVALTFPEIQGFSNVQEGSEEWTKIVTDLKGVCKVDHLPVTRLRKTKYYLIAELDSGFDMSTGGMPLDMEKMVGTAS